QRGDTINQTTRTVLVSRIHLNDLCLSAQEDVLHFLISDPSLGHPSLGVHGVSMLCAPYNCSNGLQHDLSLPLYRRAVDSTSPIHQRTWYCNETPKNRQRPRAQALSCAILLWHPLPDPMPMCACRQSRSHRLYSGCPDTTELIADGLRIHHTARRAS